jgi:hypothetical protein
MIARAKALSVGKKVLFRPCRELLTDAMAEVQEVDGVEAVEAITKTKVSDVYYYGYDERIGWETYIVMGDYGDGKQNPVGFTNGPLTSEHAR